jgi:carbon storage regulator
MQEATMLIITRKVNEGIIIGEGENRITILLNDIRGRRASIGIEAPKEIRIYREEILDRKNNDD